jgi:hypothetical protein
MTNGFDSFLTETSGMGPVPNAQGSASGGRTRGRSGWKSRAKRAGNAMKSAPGRNKPNYAPRGGGGGLDGGGGGGGR